MFYWNIPRAKAFFWGYGVQIVTGSQYLGGLVRTETDQAQWLGEKIVGWRELVDTLDRVA